MGLRLVKKTVNQDDPTVYHLFFADEKGDAGSDLTFFEYPGAPAGPRRRRDDLRDSLAGRNSTEALDFWAERLGGHGIETERGATASCASPIPRASATSSGQRYRRRAADRRAPRGPVRDGPPGIRRCARLLEQPRGEPGLFEEALGFEPREDGWEVRGESRGGLYGFDPSRPPSAACRARAASTTSPGPRRSTTTRPGATA